MSMFESAHAGHLAADVEIAQSATLGRGHKQGAPPAPGIGGRQIVDRFNIWIGDHLQRISPLLGNPYNDSIYLRSLLGNAYLLLPGIAVVLAILSLIDTGGMAVTPKIGLSIALIALGVIDSFSGLVAFVVFAFGVIFSGHFFSSHLVTGPTGSQGMLYAFTGLFGLALLWFIAPQLAEKMRPIVVIEDEVGFRKFHVIAADFFVLPFLQILILGSMPALMPSLSGAFQQGLSQVTIQEHMTTIKIVVALVMAARVAVELFLHRQFAAIEPSVPVARHPIVDKTMKVATSLLAFVLIWEIMGWMWQTPVVWVVYLLSEKLGAFGERFIKPNALFRFVPRNLFKIFVTLIFAQYAMKVLNGKFVSGTDILGWLAISLAAVTALFAILEGAKRVTETEEDLDPNAWTRITGAVVVFALFMVSQDFWHIEAKVYSSPQGVSINALNTTYITDSGNNRVIRIGADGMRSTVGSGLRNPFAAIADPSTSKEIVYISDTGHNRVLRVNLNATQALMPMHRYQMRAFAAAAGTQRSIGSGLKTPTGLAVDYAGRVFVADTGHNRVVVIDKQNNQSVFASGLQNPQAVSVDPFGNLWITDTGRGVVYKYAATDDGSTGTRTIFKDHLDHPSGVAVDASGNVFITNTGKNEVLQYRANGDEVKVSGEFAHPTAIAVNGSGHAIVANQETSEVMIITPLYKPVKYNVAPSSVGSAVGILKDGSAVVVSQEKGTIEKLTATEATILASGFDHPAGVVVTALDEIYVSEPNSGSVYRVFADGRKKKILSGYQGITALASDGYGGMYGVQPEFGNLLTISRQGVAKILVGGLDRPTDVTRDAYGYIDVSLAGKKRNGGSILRIRPGDTPVILATGLKNPTGISADDLGNVFYVEEGTGRVWEYMNALGAQIVAENSAKSGHPLVVASNANGDVFVLQSNPNRILRYILTAHASPM